MFIYSLEGNALINTDSIATVNIDAPKYEAKDWRVYCYTGRGSYLLYRGTEKECQAYMERFRSGDYDAPPADKLTRSENGITYVSKSGKRYEVVEWKVPNSERSYDIGAILYDDGRDDPGCFKVLDYFYGITLMDDAELLEWCRQIVERHEKNI